MRNGAARIVALVVLLLVTACDRAPAPAGLWDATMMVGITPVPFRYLITGEGKNLQGAFFNGDEKIVSGTVRFDKSTIVFSYPEYGSRLELTAVGNGLEGEYVAASGPVYAFEARRSVPGHRTGHVPSIEGLWTVEVPASKGESAWHLIVNQSGAHVSASILRVDGDSGAVTGSYDGRTFVLGHFSGARPLRLELTPQTDGTLAVEVDDWETYKASRAEEARAKGFPEPADPSTYSSVKDPDTPFEFSFPDIDGHVVANTDARFHRKVVIVTIGGSWCPNCHDEVPFLMELYRTYRDRGLEIVLLSFEEAQQLESLERLRAFIRRYQIEFPVLVAGDTRLVQLRLPRLVNLKAFPTTIYLGRDGLVRGVHTGFASAPTGPYHLRMREEMTGTIERLLAE